MDELAMWVGYVTMGLGVVSTIGGLALVAIALCDDAIHRACQARGVWKMYRQFCEWYETEQKKKEQSAE